MNFQSLCEIKDEPCEVIYLRENGDFSTDISSIISLVSHGPTNPDHSVKVQFEPTKTWNPVPQLPEKQNSSLYSQSKEVKSSYAKSYRSLHSNSSMEYDHELSSGNYSPLDSTSTPLIKAEIKSEWSVIGQFESTKTRNPVLQLPEKQHSSLYSQSKEVKSSYAKSYTLLNSNSSMDYNHELSRGNDSPLDLAIDTLIDAEIYPKCSVITQFDPTKTRNPVPQIPKKQHSSLYSQSEKVNSSYAKSYTSLHSNSSIDHDHELSSRNDSLIDFTSTTVIDAVINPECSVIMQFAPTKTLNPVPQLPEKQHSSLYSQSEEVKSSNAKSYTSLHSNSSMNYDHELACGNDSLLNLTSTTLINGEINRECSVITQFEPTKTRNPVLQLPEKQHSSLYSQSEEVKSSNAKSYTSLHSNSSMDYDHELSRGNDSPLDLASATLINAEIYPECSVITQFDPSKTRNPVPQIPIKQQSSLYSQSDKVNSSCAKSYTSLHSNSSINHDHELSSRNDSPLDLTYTTLRTAVPQLTGKQHSSVYCQSEEVRSSYAKSFKSLNSNSSMDYDHELSSADDSPLDLTYTTLKNDERCQQIKKKVFTPASGPEKYKLIKEQNKKRSTKYRLNYKERLKQNEDEYDHLKEKNILLQAKFIRMKQQWDRLVSISPCFTGGCAKTFQPQNHILKDQNSDDTSVNMSTNMAKTVGTNSVDKSVSISTNTAKTVGTNSVDRCKCNGQRMCETNKCSCFKTARGCTKICHKKRSCSNHFL